jgi:hypothetical protein
VKRSAAAIGVVAVTALAAVWITYFGTLRFDFIWDDYITLRPREWAELASVWHGPWDPTGLWPAFYRPLAVWADASAFSLLGFDAPALHTVALAELAIGAALAGRFVQRETDSLWLGIFTAALFAVHPAVSMSAGPWIFEQNHRLSVIAVTAALIAWQSRRGRVVFLGWWPVHAWILAGSLFKEDVWMAEPAILALQWWRSRTIGDIPEVSRRILLTTGAWCVAALTVRSVLLGGIAGWPMGAVTAQLADIVRHAIRGPVLTLIWFRGMDGQLTSWHFAASAAACIVIGLALLTIRRAPAGSRRTALAGTGAILLVSFGLPLVIASHPTRYHLLALGASIALAGCVALINSSRVGHPRIAAIGAVVLVVLFAAVSRHNVGFYQPCAPDTRLTDISIRQWMGANPVWRSSWVLEWLDEKWRLCDAGAYRPFPEAMPELARSVRAGERK